MASIQAMALNARAEASLYWPEINFYDRAAQALGKLLQVDRGLRFKPLDEQRYLYANQWLDQQCLDFFNRYPTAVGIELGAGFSTRFHRLSERHEWPQFSWVDIDSEQQIKFKKDVLPVTDNYYLLANSRPVVELFTKVERTAPLVIVIDGLSGTIDTVWLTQFLADLATHRAATSPITLMVVFNAKSPWYHSLLKLFSRPATHPSLWLVTLGRNIFGQQVSKQTDKQKIAKPALKNEKIFVQKSFGKSGLGQAVLGAAVYY